MSCAHCKVLLARARREAGEDAGPISLRPHVLTQRGIGVPRKRAPLILELVTMAVGAAVAFVMAVGVTLWVVGH